MPHLAADEPAALDVVRVALHEDRHRREAVLAGEGPVKRLVVAGPLLHELQRDALVAILRATQGRMSCARADELRTMAAWRSMHTLRTSCLACCPAAPGAKKAPSKGSDERAAR